jgi:hypothetical protein
VAVSITPNIGLNQLFSPQPTGDRSSLQVGSPKSDQEWNVTPDSDSSSTSQSADAFSAALLDVLGEIQPQFGQSTNSSPQLTTSPNVVQAGPNITAKAEPGGNMLSDVSGLNSSTVKRFQASAVVSLPTLPQAAPLFVSSASTTTSQRATNKTNESSITPDTTGTQLSSDSESAQVTANNNSIVPVEGMNVAPPPSTVPDETAPKIKATENQTVNPKDSTVEGVPVTAPAPSPHTISGPNVPDRPLEQDVVVFEGQLRPQPSTSLNQTASSNQVKLPSPVLPPVQSQGSQAGSPNGVAAAPQVPASPVSQSTSSQPSSSGTPSHAANEPAVPVSSSSQAAGPTTNSNSSSDGSLGQGTKQDQNASTPIETKGEQPAVHVVVAPADAPVGSQINPSSSNVKEVSSSSPAQPIAQQPTGPQPAVKTDMNLKVQGQSGENVTVRLSERSGSIQVTVRSADPSTTTMLRHELPSIQAGLERAGLQMQGTTPHQSASSESGNGSNGQGSGQEKKNQNAGSDSQEKQNKRNTSQQDQWFDLMEGKS